jgi:hypothetical protein
MAYERSAGIVDKVAKVVKHDRVPFGEHGQHDQDRRAEKSLGDAPERRQTEKEKLSHGLNTD